MATSAISGCRKHQCKSGALQQQCSGAAKSSAVRGSTEYLYKHQRAYRYRSPRSKCWEQGKCISVTVGSCSSAAIARDREDGQWRVEPEALSGGIAKAASKKRPKLRTGGSTLQRDAERHSGQGIGLGLNPSSRMGIRQWVRAALVQVRVLAGRLGHGLGGGGEGIQQRLFSLCLCGDLFFFFFGEGKKRRNGDRGALFCPHTLAVPRGSISDGAEKPRGFWLCKADAFKGQARETVDVDAENRRGNERRRVKKVGEEKKDEKNSRAGG